MQCGNAILHLWVKQRLQHTPTLKRNLTIFTDATFVMLAQGTWRRHNISK
jgi:hypothetical protein